jgi:hypothetical protein
MPFSQSTITSVNPPVSYRGEIHLSWTSTSPVGTWFQVYADGRLVWAGKRQSITLPGSVGTHFDIGTVATGEQYTSFTALLSTAPRNRVMLAWEGGAFLDPSGDGDVASFKVFGSTSPAGYGTGCYGQGGYGTGNATVVMTTALATIPVSSGPGNTSGYGMGGYGAGGYGQASGSYSWESDPLWSGTWTFAVAAVDREGDLGVVTLASIALAVPPREPGWDQAEPRLSYQLDGYGAGGYGGGGYGQSQISLSWLPSPG